MDAEMIILCDGVVIPQSKKEIDGGVAIAGGHILRIGAGLPQKVHNFYCYFSHPAGLNVPAA